jgi:hypothetical protein
MKIIQVSVSLLITLPVLHTLNQFMLPNLVLIVYYFLLEILIFYPGITNTILKNGIHQWMLNQPYQHSPYDLDQLRMFHFLQLTIKHFSIKPWMLMNGLNLINQVI